MRRFLMTTALALVSGAGALRAEDVALVLGTEAYETLDRFARAGEVVDAVGALEGLGFNVIALPNGRRANTAAALDAFLAAVPEADRIVVALAGRFVTDGTRTWFLTADADEPGLLSLGDRAVSVDALLTVMARAQGKAVMLLGLDEDDDGAADPWLHFGLADISPPEGVTVLAGAPRVIAGLVEDTLAVPGADLSEAVEDSGRIAVAGYMPSSFVFLPEDRAAIPLAPVVLDAVARAEEEAFWEGVVALDTAEAYRSYLNAWPRGRFAPEAEASIAAILAEPNRDARLTEEGLDLSRDERRDIQRNLTLLGYGTRGIDGILGPSSRGAIRYWQQQNGFPQTGYVTAEQINRIDAQAARRAAQLEVEAVRLAQIAAAADRAFWDETGARGDEAGLRAYLERYPDGLSSQEAAARLAEIEQANRNAAADEDRAAWDRVRSRNTIAAYRDYLEFRPNGAFVAEAEARIQAMTQDIVVAPRTDEAQAAEEALSLNSATLRMVETRLDQLGLEPGAADGELDGDSRRAIRNYQRERGLDVTGYLDEPSLVRLLADTLGGQ
jgi:peptidoglycan hydrolase-like protein with peptidoglycan-binding domain